MNVSETKDAPNAGLQEPPRCIVLIQLQRTFEGRHDRLQLSRKPERAAQVLLDCGTSHDAAMRNQNSHVSTAIEDHDVLVEVPDGCDDRIGDGPRLENGSDAIVDVRILARHPRSAPAAAPSRGSAPSISTRMSPPSTTTGKTFKQAFRGFMPCP